MRHDMAKVITEGPRWGGRKRRLKGHKRRLQQSNVEELPAHESMRRRWQTARQYRIFYGRVAPLRRFLRSRVGRPWNDVFGEICTNARFDSRGQLRLRQCLDIVVARHVVIIDDEVCLRACGVTTLGGPPQSFYVHPTSGLLHEAPNSGQDWRRFG